MNPRVIHVSYQSPYKLLLTFSNREQKQFDLTPYLRYPVFQPLQNEAFCQKAKVCFGTVAWDEVIDMDPDTLFLESYRI